MTANSRTPRARYLLPSRIADQASLGIGMLLLARQLGSAEFVPISVLVVINSIALTASDYGMGLALLRHSPGRHLSTSALRRLRLVNGSLMLAAVISGIALGGPPGRVVAFSGIIWAVSAEAFVRKSAALRLLADREVALAEIVGSVVFLIPVGAALNETARALAFTALAFAAKHLTEVLIVRTWKGSFDEDGDNPQLGALLLTQVLALAIGNVDYAVIGFMFTPEVFSVYVLAFRIANVMPRQVANVAVRVSLVGFAAAGSEGRQSTYDRYVSNLFIAGMAGATITAAASPLLPWFLGESWRSVTLVVVVLAIAVPFRLVLPMTGSLAISGGATTRLVRWESFRIIVYSAAFVTASTLGFGPMVATVAIANIGACDLYHLLVARVTEIRPVRFLLPVGLAASAAAMVASAFITTPS